MTSETNQLVCDRDWGILRVLDGFSADTISSFATPNSEPYGITVIANDLISCGRHGDDKIYQHDGVTSTIKTSFVCPGGVDTRPAGLAYDNANNLWSINAKLDYIYQHNGVTVGLLNTYNLNSLNFGLVRGVAWANTEEGNRLYVSAKDLVSGDGWIITFDMDDLCPPPDILDTFVKPGAGSISSAICLRDGDLICLDDWTDIIRCDGISNTILETLSVVTPGNIGGLEPFGEVISKDVDISAIIIQTFQTDIDMEIYIAYGVPAHRIQILVESTIYSCDSDEKSISSISHQLQKDYGVSKVADVKIELANTDERYSPKNASSIFYGVDYIWSWIRVRSGWGDDLDTDVETQFQGKLYQIDNYEDYSVSWIGYDPIKDLMEYRLDEAITFNAALVAATALESLSPMHIIKYLIEEVFEIAAVSGLKWFDFDTSTYEDIIDDTTYQAALDATIQILVSATVWDAGSNMLTMIQDLLKIIGGYMYSSREGKLKFYVPSPGTLATTNNYTGDYASASRELFSGKLTVSYDNIINRVIFKTGANATERGPWDDSDSISTHGVKAKEITTQWEVSATNLASTAALILARFANPIIKFTGDLTYIHTGTALGQELGDAIGITDPTHALTGEYFELHKINRKLMEENIHFESYDATALEGKFALACSEADQGDGYGITADDFNNWVYRFAFAGHAEDDDPHTDANNPGFDNDGNVNGVIDPDFPPIDNWGNGIEEIFVVW